MSTERLRRFIEDQRVGERPMTQAEFADSIGFRREYVNRVLGGSQPITDGFVGRFANIYGYEAAREVFGHREQAT